MAQGASQSVEDALVLARCLAADRAEPERAIDAYAVRRKNRTAAIQSASRDAGRLAQLADPVEIQARNERLGANPEAPVARFDWIWNYDVERASFDEQA
jgi:salicylate hydroxylase